MSDKKEGAIYQCDAGHWYVQSVGSGPGSWSLPFVGCPVCKLSSESKRADDMMHRGDSWREMCDELEAKLKGQSLRLGKRSAQLVEALRVSNEQGSRLNKALDALKFIAWQGLPDTKSGYAKGVLMELTGAVEKHRRVERCGNTPCALDDGHAGECSSVRPLGE